ncbi:MAG: hypothetical protein WBF11_09080, partial [Methyloceanibacter sp.]
GYLPNGVLTREWLGHRVSGLHASSTENEEPQFSASSWPGSVRPSASLHLAKKADARHEAGRDGSLV